MNPVTEALAAARLRQLGTKDQAMAAVVAEIVGPTPKHDRSKPQAFIRWCEQKGTTALPASISAVALFVLEHQKDGLETVLAHLADISGSHCDAGLADPTTSYPATAALNKIARVEPPRSWDADGRALFLGLPYAVQRFVLKRETERDVALRQAQNRLAEERKSANATKETISENPIQQNAVA
jgi:hypothetical protein